MQIDIERVTVAFGDRVVLDSFSATLPSHSVTAIVGPSGSGKSSLLAAIAGFLKPQDGRVRYRDAECDAIEPTPELIGWVSQGANALGRRSVIDNVAIGAMGAGTDLRESYRIAAVALERVGLTPRAQMLSRNLSGGELQRVGFARALASSRPIILADEPSSSLDSESTRSLAQLLQSLRATATIVVATHDPILMRAAAHVVELRDFGDAA